ncbi:MAG: DNA polymerase IV [Terriglobia bacterium]
MKQIAHVDMDAFFVSVEELYEPSLKGKAVVVGGASGDERGVVAAANYEARKFGVHSAMPLRTAKRLCPHAIFLPGNFDRYEEWSEKIRALLERYTPVVQMVSIDEAYLDLTGTERLHGSAWATAAKIQRTIWEETRPAGGGAGLPCSIGVAQSYIVAKVASDLAKPRGLLWVPPGAEAAFLAPLPVHRIPGIGKVTEKALAALDVTTVGELSRLKRDRLVEVFGRWGEALYRKARGEDAELWFVEEEQKSISHERTFARDTAETNELEATLSYLAQLVGKRLRDAGLYARTITLKLRYADFKTLSRALTLEEPTELDRAIYETARGLFLRHWKTERPVRLLGIALSNLTPGAEQLSLLDADERARLEKLARAADRLRDRFGFDAVQTATSLQGGRKAD